MRTGGPILPLDVCSAEKYLQHVIKTQPSCATALFDLGQLRMNDGSVVNHTSSRVSKSKKCVGARTVFKRCMTNKTLPTQEIFLVLRNNFTSAWDLCESRYTCQYCTRMTGKTCTACDTCCSLMRRKKRTIHIACPTNA